MVFKALELSHHPGYERLIDVSQQGVQRRWGVSSVVLDPTPQEWIELLGDVLQRQLCLMAKFQFPNCRWRITEITQLSAFGISLDNASAIDNN
jgi:hypothetical protein